MARLNIDQVTELVMETDNSDNNSESNDSVDMITDDSIVSEEEIANDSIIDSDYSDPGISSQSSDSDSESNHIPYAVRGRPRVRGRGVRTRGGQTRTRLSVSRPRCGPRNRLPDATGDGIQHVSTGPLDEWSSIEQDPPTFDFVGNPGLKNPLQPNAEPGDYFDLFLTPECVDLMVEETNRYANAEINKSRPLRKDSRLNKWQDTDATEMRKFLALLLHMGPNSLPSLEHYWSTDVLYSNVFYTNVMSRNRFQLLLRFWHFVDNDLPHEDDRLYKIRPVLDHFNNVIEDIYYPERELCIDESMVLWRGRLLFRQYIKNKKHKYGIKLYELCESRGFIQKIRIYSGVGYPNADIGQSAAVVLDLMDGFLDKGHILYTDNYYNSVSLTKRLTDRETYLCGTLRFDRKENPKDVVKAKLKRGESIWKRSESVVVSKWKDKRDVLTISNMHKFQMVEVPNRNNVISMKPNLIRDYNNGMAGIDRSDQMLSYYSALRKSLRWYKKIGLHILEMMVINSFILYNDGSQNRMKLLSFRERIVHRLIGTDEMDRINRKGRSSQRASFEDFDPSTFHYMKCVPPSEKKSKPTKPCRVCTKNKVRKETRYECVVCAERPALCVENCFQFYHTEKFGM